MCYRNRTIGVVVPAFNEELLINATLNSIPKYVDRIYVVDDCSNDRTAEIAEEFEKNDSRFKYIKHNKNMGVGAAIITGYKEALRDKIEIAAVMAGDNQMDPENLPSLLDPIVDENADYTKGNRLLHSHFRIGMSNWRFFGNTILTFLTKMASGYWHLMDPQNGYTAISIKALERINPDSIYSWYGYCNDLLVRLNVFGFKVKDVVMPARYGSEKSKIKYGRYICKVSWLLFRDFFWRLKMKYVWMSFHPLVIFYLIGILLTPVGIFGGIYAIYYKFFLGGDIFVRGVLSLLIFIIGIQFLSFAMFFDMQTDSSINGINGDRNGGFNS
jgi:glycosyltransferase involved in cell wall biosynthesis